MRACAGSKENDEGFIALLYYMLHNSLQPCGMLLRFCWIDFHHPRDSGENWFPPITAVGCEGRCYVMMKMMMQYSSQEFEP